MPAQLEVGVSQADRTIMLIYIYILPQKSYKPISNIDFFDMC